VDIVDDGVELIFSKNSFNFVVYIYI
jgi:hypothetical protein